MGQQQGAHTAVGRQGTGLPGCQVPVVPGQAGLGIGEGALGDQQVGPVRQVLGTGTRGGVHDQGEPLAGTELADVLQADAAQHAVPLQPADVGTADAGGREPLPGQGSPVRLLEAVAVGLDAMAQGPDRQAGSHLPGRPVGVQPEVEPAGGQGDQRPDHGLPGDRIVQVHRVLHAVQRHAGEDTGHPIAVVTVDVGQADPPDPAGCHAREGHLPLGSLAGIEQEPLAVPQQQVAVLVALTGGDLRGGAEDHEFSHAPRLARILRPVIPRCSCRPGSLNESGGGRDDRLLKD
ncbi:hypothetical protein GGQ69_001045 [Micrococcus sp. TA1]|mgnify:CR=1 FL=1|nr:hypothetical protein [Micrococcus sp. TA1]